jgi:hypothetical protein
MNRRDLFLGTAAIALAGHGSAEAQAFKVPSPDVLYNFLKTPQQADALAYIVSSLRTLLLLHLSRRPEGNDINFWHRDREKFFELVRLLGDQWKREIVSKLIDSRDPRAIAEAITEPALPVARNIERILHEGGLQAGSPLSNDLIGGFLSFNRYIVALSPDDRGWYCRIFPLSYACG